MLLFNETPIEPTAKIKKAVSEYARNGGGIHRMNVSDFSFYAFTPFKDDKGKEDFCGGWESAPGLKSSPFTHVRVNQTSVFMTIENAIKKYAL